MSKRTLWQFYITFWSTFFISFFIIYGLNIHFFKNVMLSSFASAVLSIINLFINDKRKKLDAEEFKKHNCGTGCIINHENLYKNVQKMELKQIMSGLHDILCDYSSDVYYRDVLVNTIENLHKLEKRKNK